MIYPYMNPKTAINVVPSNSGVFDPPILLFVNIGGNVRVHPAAGGSAVTFAVKSGSWIPLICRTVYASGTTADGIIGLK